MSHAFGDLYWEILFWVVFCLSPRRIDEVERDDITDPTSDSTGEAHLTAFVVLGAEEEYSSHGLEDAGVDDVGVVVVESVSKDNPPGVSTFVNI